nr:hypothetical protein Iba_chr12aCG1530 [Ipomoea batatas]
MCLPQPRMRISNTGRTVWKMDKLHRVTWENFLGVQDINKFPTQSKLPS